MPAPDDKAYYSYSVAVNETIQIVLPLSAANTWDAFWRSVYQKANAGIQRQANMLVKRGNITLDEARHVVEVQRNGLVRELRKPLTPFGRLYSEILKPSNRLPTLDQLLKKKGSVEAVLRSAGGTRQVVNRLAIAARVAGTATLVLEVGMSVVVVALADEEERSVVAAKQVGGAIGSIGGGLGGSWAGCATFAALAAPTLVIPVVGEISTGTACLVGGIVGGLSVGAVARAGGEYAAEWGYWKMVSWDWL